MSKSICKKEISVEWNTVAFTFDGREAEKISIDDLPKATVRRLALHGLSQKLGDSYASNTGVDDAIRKFNDVLNMLKGGHWSAARSGGGGVLAQVVAELTGKGLDEVTEMIRGLDAKGRRALGAQPQVAVEVARVKVERAMKAAELATDTGLDLEALFEAEEKNEEDVSE